MMFVSSILTLTAAAIALRGLYFTITSQDKRAFDAAILLLAAATASYLIATYRIF
tara:strand:+ start:87 stop:251 length:165 start_codon:yes stop_codon:yes gene_type:complete